MLISEDGMYESPEGSPNKQIIVGAIVISGGQEKQVQKIE